jgi:hypothetical protein
MPANAKLDELKKNRRLSLLHVRRATILFGFTAAGLLVAQHFIGIRLWIPFLILGILSFTVVGDIINYFYCGRKIRKLQQDKTA